MNKFILIFLTIFMEFLMKENNRLIQKQIIRKKLTLINFFPKDLILYDFHSMRKFKKFTNEKFKIYIQFNKLIKPQSKIKKCENKNENYGFIIFNNKCYEIFDLKKKIITNYYNFHKKKEGIVISQNNKNSYKLNFICSNNKNKLNFDDKLKIISFYNKEFCGIDLKFLSFFIKYNFIIKIVLIILGILILLLGSNQKKISKFIVGIIFGFLVIIFLYLKFFKTEISELKIILFLGALSIGGIIFGILFVSLKNVPIIGFAVFSGYILSIYVFKWTKNLILFKGYYYILILSIILVAILTSLLFKTFILIMLTSILGAFMISYFSYFFKNKGSWLIFTNFLDEIINLRENLPLWVFFIMLLFIGIIIQSSIKTKQDQIKKIDKDLI